MAILFHSGKDKSPRVLRDFRGHRSAGPLSFEAGHPEAPPEPPREKSPAGRLGALAVLAALFVLMACDPSGAKNFGFQAVGSTNEDFEEPVFVGVGNNPVSLAVADFDGDGDQDVAVVNRFETLDDPEAAADPDMAGTMTVLANDGAGAFTVTAQLEVGITPATLMVGEFNGDGAPDLALLNEAATVITIMLNDGTGAFTLSDVLLSGTSARMVLADLNGDGSLYQDIVVTVTDSLEPVQPGIVTALVNDGAGAFTLVDSLTEDASLFPSPGPVIVEDWDEDGRPDLAVADFRRSRVIVMRGEGEAGAFVPVGEPFEVGSFPFNLIAGDFTGDGIMDIAVAPLNEVGMWLLEGLGGGAFAESELSPISLAVGGGGVEGFLRGQFTADGNDLIVLQSAGTKISLLDWAEDGTFEVLEIEVSDDPFAVIQGDFNRDGENDLITSERIFRLFSIHAGAGDGTFERTVIGFDNLSTVPTAVDVNGDGGLDILFIQPDADRLGVLLNCHPSSGAACP